MCWCWAPAPAAISAGALRFSSATIGAVELDRNVSPAWSASVSRLCTGNLYQQPRSAGVCSRGAVSSMPAISADLIQVALLDSFSGAASAGYTAGRRLSVYGGAFAGHLSRLTPAGGIAGPLPASAHGTTARCAENCYDSSDRFGAGPSQSSPHGGNDTRLESRHTAGKNGGVHHEQKSAALREFNTHYVLSIQPSHPRHACRWGRPIQ